MIEIGVAFGILGALVGAAALLARAAWETLFVVGLGLMGLGMVVGVPAGWLYHVRLYQALAARDALSRWWWLHPTALHRALGAPDRPRVMRWFYIGALGFCAAVLGCFLAAVGALRSR
jgi:hypothetical protein